VDAEIDSQYVMRIGIEDLVDYIYIVKVDNILHIVSKLPNNGGVRNFPIFEGVVRSYFGFFGETLSCTEILSAVLSHAWSGHWTEVSQWLVLVIHNIIKMCLLICEATLQPDD
jgi:hypothetical protein